MADFDTQDDDVTARRAALQKMMAPDTTEEESARIPAVRDEATPEDIRAWRAAQGLPADRPVAAVDNSFAASQAAKGLNPDGSPMSAATMAASILPAPKAGDEAVSKYDDVSDAATSGAEPTPQAIPSPVDQTPATMPGTGGYSAESFRLRMPFGAGVSVVSPRAPVYSTPATATDLKKTDAIQSKMDDIMAQFQNIPKPETASLYKQIDTARADAKSEILRIQDQSDRQDLINAFGRMAAGLIGAASLQNRQGYGINVSGIEFDKKDYQKLKEDVWKTYAADKDALREKIAQREGDYTQDINKLGMENQLLKGQGELAHGGEALQVQQAEGAANRTNALQIAGGNNATTLAAAQIHASATASMWQARMGAKPDQAAVLAEKDYFARVAKAQGEREKGMDDFTKVGLAMKNDNPKQPIDSDAITDAAVSAARRAGVPDKIVNDIVTKYTTKPYLGFGSPTVDSTNVHNLYRDLSQQANAYKGGVFRVQNIETGAIELKPKSTIPSPEFLAQKGYRLLNDPDAGVVDIHSLPRKTNP